MTRLEPGARLGAFEIVALLGAGGMGEVYRAHDPRLRRDVALKVLPADVVTDDERLARFEREAQVLAALNHSHIGAIYGIEEAGGLRALVLELVEGRTLAQRLRGGAVPLAEALAIATQIAEALEAAHDRGILHRDLKPANVMIAAGGHVKLLDFGLAKVVDPISLTDRAAVTRTNSGTRSGVVLGTAAYMSPEQARGLAVDKRTDVWAFGCVLYEMLTGRTAFGGETLSDTLARVLERQPEWSRLPSETPAAIHRLLRRCLEKDPRRRLRDVGDARLELGDALTTKDETVGGNTPARLWLTTVVVTAALTAAVAMMWLAMQSRPIAQRETVRFTLTLREGEQLPSGPGMPASIAISPDGTQIVYSVRSGQGTRLFLRQLGEFDSTPVAGSEGGIGPFFSADGEWLGFASAGSIRVLPLSGGTARRLAETPNFTGASWGADGTVLFGPDWLSGLYKVHPDGGPVQTVTTVDGARGEIAHYTPYMLPGGRAALLSVGMRNAATEVHVVDLTTGERRRLLEGRTPQYLASGHLLVANGGTLLIAPFDLERLQLTGAPTPVLNSVRENNVASQFAAARNGTLAYAPAEGQRDRRLMWVTRRGRLQQAFEESGVFVHPRISPDGSRVVVWAVQESGDGEIWTYAVSTGARTRLPSPGGATRPIWEPDGKRITVQIAGKLVSMPASGGESRLILSPSAPATGLFPLAWSPKGGILLYSRPVASTGHDVWTVRPGEAPEPFLSSVRGERSAMFSPDGRWIVYTETEPGRDEQVYVHPYPGPGDRVGISPGGGTEPVWSPTGREIFYRSLDGRRMMTVAVGTTPGFTASVPRQLFEFEGSFRPRPGAFWSNYDVSPDGERFLMVEDQAEVETLKVIVGAVYSQLQPK